MHAYSQVQKGGGDERRTLLWNRGYKRQAWAVQCSLKSGEQEQAPISPPQKSYDMDNSAQGYC